MKKLLILIILLLTFNFIVEGYEITNNDNVLYVGGSGPGNYTTIQSAIDNASVGDIIFIYKGIYYETPWVNKSLSIIGEDSQFTIIDGKQSEINNIFSVNTSFFNLRDVTIQNSSFLKYGIYLKNVKNNSIIKNCTVLTERGIHIVSSNNITVFNCLFDGGRDGIVLSKGDNCTISDCKITIDEDGININLDSNNNIVNNCKIFRNNESSYLSHGCQIYSDNNRIFNTSCKYCFDGLHINGNKTIIQNCTFDNNLYRGISIDKGELNTFINCEINNNGNINDFPSFGIEIFHGLYNHIDSCKISNNGLGGVYISFWGGNNIITKSTIERNGFISSNGVGIQCFSFNRIFLNNFIGNNIQAQDYYSNSEWDNGKYGNFWSDYNGHDWNGDGIGDKSYLLFNNSNDDFPLLCPYNSDGPSVLLERPAHFKGDFLYLRNLRILKSSKTLLIGNIMVKARAVNYDNPERITKVEFFVDGVLRHVDIMYPYKWCWRLSSPLNHKHIISVIAYDSKGRIGQDSCQVYKFM